MPFQHKEIADKTQQPPSAPSSLTRKLRLQQQTRASLKNSTTREVEISRLGGAFSSLRGKAAASGGRLLSACPACP